MNLASRVYSEKRNFIRMQVDTPVRLSLTADDEEVTGVCHDLSGGGMLVELEKPLPAGTECLAVISSRHGHSPMLKARTRVSRVDSGPQDNCLLGLEIIELLT